MQTSMYLNPNTNPHTYSFLFLDKGTLNLFIINIHFEVKLFVDKNVTFSELESCVSCVFITGTSFVSILDDTD
jgi:hypothetical protein